jgi:hypothetical protein
MQYQHVHPVGGDVARLVVIELLVLIICDRHKDHMAKPLRVDAIIVPRRLVPVRRRGESVSTRTAGTMPNTEVEIEGERGQVPFKRDTFEGNAQLCICIHGAIGCAILALPQHHGRKNSGR